MDTASDGRSGVTLSSGGEFGAAYPVRCAEEVLLPSFTDQSLHAIMEPRRHAAPAELRLVLLGRKGAGKSAAGDTILGGAGGFQSGRPTEECVKRRAEVEGRRVAVVDTPGWEWYYPLNGTPGWVRRETLRSVSLCPPGPHAVLLVVRSRASVTDAYVGEMEEHLRPLGAGVWEHAMVLFTRGDELGLATMEQRILASGAALHRLLQKCGNRYHVVNNRSGGDGTQVTELLRKVEEMVRGGTDGNDHLEVDGAVLRGLEAEGKRRARERRKKQRQMEAQVQRGTIMAALTSGGPQGSELDAHQSFSKAARRLPEVRLVLLGERETGKSSAGNTILGKTGLFAAGEATEECVRRQEEVSARLVTVVDTPGWEAGVAGATPERVKREIVCSVTLCPPGPHALLLTLRVDTLVRAEHIREHLELLGEGVWRHTVLLFTHGDQLRQGVDIEQHIQGGGRDLQWLLEKCRRRYHVIGSTDGVGGGKATELLEKVEKMATMNRCEAFSSLVQEVRDLSHQRNEKFSQRLKEVGDKMARQEAELKNLREREMKSIRWFLYRRKKVKSPGKADVPPEEEDDEDRRAGERKSDVGDLEERIRWLTEDREREVQDLCLENERIRVELSQNRRERDEAALNLELKEREAEELRERSDELQLKLLDLERADAERQHERKQREDAIRALAREWRKELEKREETIGTLKDENAEWTEKVNCLEVEMEKTKKDCDELFQRKEEEKNKQTKDIVEMERKLLEKDKRQEELRQKASEEKQTILDKLKQREEEMERRIREMEERMEILKVQQEEEIQKIISENADLMERIKEKHDEKIQNVQQEKLKNIRELKEELQRDKEEDMKAQQREMDELEQNHVFEMQEKQLEYEKEVTRIHLDHEEEMKRWAQEREEEMKTSTALMEETERKVREKEDDLERVQQRWTERLRESRLENDELKRLIGDLEEKHADLERSKEEELKQQLQKIAGEREREKEGMRRSAKEKERETEDMKLRMEEMARRREESEKDAELKLQARDQEVEEMRLEVAGLKVELQKMEEKEKDRLEGQREVEETLREREEELRRLTEVDEKREREVQQMERAMEELQKKVEDKDEILQRKEEERDEVLLERKKEAEEMKEKLQEKDGELERLRRQDAENQQEVARLASTIELTKAELKQLTDRMEEETTSMIREYEKEIAEKNERIAAIAKETDTENQNNLRVATEKYELSQRRNEELHRRNEKLEEEVEGLKVWCEEVMKEKELEMKEWKESKEELQAEIERLMERVEEKKEEEEKVQVEEEVEEKVEEGFPRREKETEEREEESSRRGRDLEAKQEELMLSSREEELEVLDTKIKTTKETKDEQQAVTGRREDSEMKRDHTGRGKDEETNKEFAKRENGEDGGEVLHRNEEELSRRGRDLEAKEEELREKALALERKEEELRNMEAALERREKSGRDTAMRAQNVEKMERELERLLDALEDKQRELSSHGQDLQTKLRGLKDQGRELKDREHHLKNEERELIGWKSELLVQNRHVASTTQELDQLGRDLALLKEELHGKERNLKDFFRKLSKWEQTLAEREEELSRTDWDGSPPMYQEVSERREKGRGPDRDERAKENEDQMANTSLTDNCQLETLKEEKTDEETGSAKVTPHFKLVNNKDRPGSDLRVVVLGETWSSRSPGGVTIFGGEPSQPDGSTFRFWKGQVEGRRLAIAEPAGLRWRDGPDPDQSQRESVLAGAAWCRPGPHVVLLLMPAFLTCTAKLRRAAEEQVELLGQEAWRRALVLFTWAELLGESAEQHILRNRELTELVERCGGGYHALASGKSSAAVQRLLQKMEEVADK